MENYEKVTWINPESNFEELNQSGKFEEIIRLSYANSDLLISLCQNSEVKRLKKSISFATVMLSYFERSLQENIQMSAIFWAGKLKGYVETMDKLQFASDQNQMAVERAKLLKTKHLDEIVLSLETHGTMSQTELSESLKLRTSTLSEALKKIRRTHLVYVSSQGKYKVYSLTEYGARYCVLLRKKQRHQTEIEAVMQKLQLYLQNPNIRESCLKALNDTLSETSDIDIIRSIGKNITTSDYKQKFNVKFYVNQMLEKMNNSGNGATAPFVGKTNSSFRYSTDDAMFQNERVRKL